MGAGLSGLACALELSSRGVEVEVLEADAAVGGRMNTRRREGFAFDCGASFLADCYSNVEVLAARAGVPVRSVGLVEHVVVRGGRMHRLNFSGWRDALRFGGLSAWTRARALVLAAWVSQRYARLDFFDLSSVPDALRRESAYDFARRAVGTEFADYVVDPFTSTMMFYRAHDICAGAFVALFTMMASGRYSFGIRRLVGGMQALPVALARRVPVRTGCPVRRVRADGAGVLVETAGQVRRCDAVVLACPAPAALKILADPTPRQRELLERTRYSETMDVSFRVPVEALGDVHCHYVPFRESPLISEFTNEAIKGEETVRGGLTLVNVGLHDAGAQQLAGRPDHVVFDRVAPELARLHPGIARHAHRLEPNDIQRWAHAIPQYDGEHVARVSRFWSRGQGEGAVWLAGDYLNHPWLEGAARCGVRVAERVAAAVSKPLRLLTPAPAPPRR